MSTAQIEVAQEYAPVIINVLETQPIAVIETPVKEKVKTVEPATPRNIARNIKDITEYASARLAALGDVTFTADQYEAAIQDLKELKKIITGFERLLSRSNAALLDEKAQLLKRLEEIQRATNVRVTDAPDEEVKTKEQKSKETKPKETKPKEKKQSWADVTFDEERRAQKQSTQQSHNREESPEPFDNSSERSSGFTPRHTDDFEEPKQRSRRKGNNRGGCGQLNIPFLSTGYDASSWRDTSSGRDGNTPGGHRAFDDSRPKNRQGSRIPTMSANPLMLKRRITHDDLEDFTMHIKQDVKYGELVTFASPQSGEIMIGGIINIVTTSDGRSASRSGICEPLYYEGMCNCSTTALVLHGGKPLQLSLHDFVGVLHKFINNFNGNHFHPNDVSKIHIDAIILRCVVYAITQIIGFRRGQMTITLDTFSDATDPRNLLNAIDEYYKNRKDEFAMSIARGLFIALGTHFVSS